VPSSRIAGAEPSSADRIALVECGAPWWVWVGFVGWLGIFILLPIWSIWLGTALRRASAPVQ